MKITSKRYRDNTVSITLKGTEEEINIIASLLDCNAVEDAAEVLDSAYYNNGSSIRAMFHDISQHIQNYLNQVVNCRGRWTRSLGGNQRISH